MGKTHIDLDNKTILVTGSPGFIGANLVLRLLRTLSGGTVISLDNMNDYYDPKLKEYRLSLIEKAAEHSPVRHVFVRGSIADKALVEGVFARYAPQVVVNLAAQAGVRYSIDHPDVYIESNLIGFYNILEACRHNPVEHLVYASSSSVYGGNKKCPSARTIRWITRSACTPPPKRAMNCWRTAIPSCMKFRPPACASSRCMARPAARICSIFLPRTR